MKLSRSVGNVAVLILAAVSALLSGSPAYAGGFIKTFTGKLRLYDFQRINQGNKPGTLQSFSLGGGFHAATNSFYGLSAGATFYAAEPLGLNDYPTKTDNSLPGNTVTSLTEGYLNYSHRGAGNLRVGDQLFLSPWANPSDSRMIPATFQGVVYDSPKVMGFALTAARIYRWKNRTAEHFGTTNLLGESTSGFLALGLKYRGHGLAASFWHYRFYAIADMEYLQGMYHRGIYDGATGLLGFQYLNETDAGSARLGPVDTNAYGLLAGARIGPLTLTLGLNHIAPNAGAYHGGDIVSPYTHSYATDPLYTTSMTQGMVEQNAAGNAWKLKGVYWALRHHLRMIASYARYNVDRPVHVGQTGNPHEIDVDATYFFGGRLKGLSLRDRVGFFDYPGAPQTFIYNRVMVQYPF